MQQKILSHKGESIFDKLFNFRRGLKSKLVDDSVEAVNVFLAVTGFG